MQELLRLYYERSPVANKSKVIHNAYFPMPSIVVTLALFTAHNGNRH